MTGTLEAEGIANQKPGCYYIGLTKNTRFTGRTSILEMLEEKFFGEESCQKAALVGLGGVGKTQIALRFVYETKKKRPDYSIFWVPVLSEESAERAYTEIAKKLGLQKSHQDDDVKDLVCQYLSSDEAGKWLFVVDNADDEDLMTGSADKSGLEDFFPQSETGIVLMTTRSGHIAADFAQSDVIDIEQMDESDASNLFKNCLIRKSLLHDKELVVELLTYLTFLPLAITQAAAYLNQTKAPIQTYLGLLQGAEKDVAGVLGREFKDTTRYKDSRNAVGTTWLVTFDQLQKSDDVAVDLLSFISCVEPKAIPQSILPNTDHERTEWAVGLLCSYSFLARREGSNTFDMHSLVHMATRQWVNSQNRMEKVVNDAICHLANIFPARGCTCDALRREYLPHVTRLLHYSDGLKVNDTYILLEEVGAFHLNDRRFEEAARCYEEVCQWRQSHQYEINHDRLAAEEGLARAYLGSRRINEAIKLFEHITSVQKEILDEDDQTRLVSEHALAFAYLEARQTKKSLEILENITQTQRHTLDEKHHLRLSSEHELARAYLYDGRAKDAIIMLDHITSVENETRAKTDRKRLISQQLLAFAYVTSGRMKEAITIYEYVVGVKETLDETDHDRLVAQQELAIAYIEDGRYKAAIDILGHILSIQEVIHDENDQGRLHSEHLLGSAYLEDEQYNIAIPILERVATLRQNVLHKKDVARLTSEYELGRAYLEDGQLKRAIDLLENVVAIRKEILSEKDSSSLASQHTLGRGYLRDGQVKKAIKILDYLVTVQQEISEKGDTSRLASELLFGCAYYEDGQMENAITLFEHVNTIRKGTAEKDNLLLRVSQCCLGLAYFNDQQFNKAIEMFEIATTIENEISDQKRAMLRHKLGETFPAEGRFKTATTTLDKVAAILKKCQMDKNPTRLTAEEELEKLYLEDQRGKDAIATGVLETKATSPSPQPS